MKDPGGRSSGPVALELLGRRGLLLVAAATALTSVLAGLARLGVAVGWGPAYGDVHGPLFVLGVFGTVISLERAVALASPWAFAAPAAGAAAAVAMWTRLPWAPWVAVASNLAMVAINVAIVRRQSATFTWLMLLGSTVLLVGDLVWALGNPVFEAVPTWIAFFVLTIAAERLELSRLAPTPRWASRLVVVLSVSFAFTACACAAGVEGWSRAFGITMAALAAWQLRFDLARRTVYLRGLPRFSAIGVLLGALWLLVSGVLFAVYHVPPVGPLYDAALHGVFVGYVLSMVLAHAPIILPAVARTNVPFHPGLFAGLTVLHVGLLVRVFGDVSGLTELRRLGSILNAIALAIFPLTIVLARQLRRPCAKHPAGAEPRRGGGR